MSEIKPIQTGIKAAEANKPKDTRQAAGGSSPFSSELKKSIDKIEKMGSAIDVANTNLTTVESDISNISNTVDDLSAWINQIQGVITDISQTDGRSQQVQAKKAYDQAVKTDQKPNPSDENV